MDNEAKSDGVESNDYNPIDEEEYAEFERLLEEAERAGRLPYHCPHCDFTTNLLTGVFYHRAEDCAGLDFCNICGDKSPDVYHYLRHGFECLSPGNYEAYEDESASSTCSTLDGSDSEIEDADLNASSAEIDLTKE